ncbi:MAG: 3-isopropylmalate dehydrogenase [Pyrinomonadaceae bacterium]|nr:3-isopropylmalate dehydrogenase [Pyrinomonadaceae bacterium]
MKLAVLAGDGIGKEVTREAVNVLERVSNLFDIDVRIEQFEIGAEAIKANGSPLPERTLEGCLESDAVLLGAVGSPEFDDLLPEDRPEIGLLNLRKHLGGFANLRPAKSHPSLVNSSPLRPEIFEGTDLLIVRELLGGIYFGEPRGFSEDRRRAFNTLTYSAFEIERVARIAFDIARDRKKKLTSVDKANVLESSRLWRETVNNVAAEYPDVELEHLFVDACAMHLVTDPNRFDVILTGNLFGDILSDEAAVLTGSLGMLASATIGGKVDLYEPVHGSAPDIAGKNQANPLGAIECAAMCLAQTANKRQASEAIQTGVQKVLSEGYRTVDLITNADDVKVTTEEMGELVGRYATESANFTHAHRAV